MTRHILDDAGLLRLKRVASCRADQLVLDINAVYIVGPNETTKVEALAVVPEPPEHDGFDEIFPIKVEITGGGERFESLGEEGFAYRVAAEDVNVIGVDVVRVAVRSSTDEALQASTANEQTTGVNVIDCGVLLHTDRGVLVAYQRHPGFGFDWGTHHFGALLSREAALELVQLPYEIVTIA